MTEKKENNTLSIWEKTVRQCKGREMQYFTYFTVILLYITAFLCDSPGEIFRGMVRIVMSRDTLITDYFSLAGYGASFFNAALVSTICLAVTLLSKVPFTGPTMAALFINIGYSFWGKNVLNILPVLLGTWLYAKLHHLHFGRYIYTALFSTCLAPFVTEMAYVLPFAMPYNLILAVLTGILVGYIMPPIAAHTVSMHMGYNLFNVGFSAGIIAFVLFCILRGFDIAGETVLIWQKGRPVWLAAAVYGYFVVAAVLGFFLSGRKWSRLKGIFRHPGRAVADFVLMDGPGPTLMNMGLVGMLGLTYILLIGGDLCGPVVGAIIMAFGFASFGAHLKNYLPVLVGVFCFSLISVYTPTTPGIQLAALFAVGLAPVAGQFGVIPGVVSGMLHSAIVMCTATMYGGLNLYNNGFSAGWVAIFMVPVIESFMNHFADRKERLRRQQHGEH